MRGVYSCLFICAVALVSELSGEIGEGKKETGLTLKVLQTARNQTIQKKVIRLTEGHVLNLTCTAEGGREVDLSWYVPSSVAKSQHRLKDRSRNENRNLVISPISEVDSGVYQCEAISSQGEHLRESVRVYVEPDWGDCKPGFYNCNNTNNYCIHKRYRCDGQRDCPFGDDESEFPCGIDPCKGKISCPELDFRCIDPSQYCCDPETDYDCKVLYPCCKAVLDYNTRIKHKQPELREHSAGYDNIFYTAIGCCIVFILVVGMVYGWLKYQSVKSARLASRQRPPITLHDLDLMYGGPDQNDRNLSITFNINHGVQIMRPPPYSNRSVNAGPPPPYMAQDNAQDPLLEESNNNGDINGNSNLMDNNNPIRNLNLTPAPPAADSIATAALHSAASTAVLPSANSTAVLANTDDSEEGVQVSASVTPPLGNSTPEPNRHSQPPPPPPYPGLERARFSDTSTETE